MIEKDKADKKRLKKQRQKARKQAELQAQRARERAERQEQQIEDEEEDLDEDGEEEEEDEEVAGPVKKIACGVTIQDIRIGQGVFAADRRPVRLHYVGMLDSGEEFERSKSSQPMKFRLGRGEVIKGWDLGVMGMRVGGRRKIVCPPGAAYGARAVAGNAAKGTKDIPANATLTFIVTLVDAKP